MNKLTKYLTKPFLDEDIKIPVEVGDTILMGRFKNKRVVVKSIDFNDKGDLLINGRPALKFRVVKKVNEAPRVPRKKGQHRGSKSHSDLYTDENPKGTIKGLKFATVKDAQASVNKIKGSGKSHAHKIQAAVAMEQRAREMGKSSQAAVYRAYINKMKKKTKAKNEEFGAPAGTLPSPSRKMVKKMKKKGNTSVPYGSGYKKVNEANAVKGNKVSKFITGHNLTMKGKKYKEIEFETLGVDNSSKMVKLRILSPKNLFGMETPVKFSTLRRGPFTKTDTGKKVKENLDLYMKKVVASIVENENSASNLKEQKIKKVIGIYGGRFQPFHKGHLATFKWLKGRVDDAFITTSDIKQPPRHPMSFKEKVRHMTKMGVPKNRIVMEKSPYVAKNLLKKYDPETTAVVYVVGEKDAGRLGGKYFKPYTTDMKGFDEHGYILTAPQQGSISGTKARELLGSPSADDSERQKRFKNVFGYFDKGIYNMMTNKFKKLFETYTLSDDLIKEFLIEATGTPAGNLDDGPSTYYQSLGAYKKVSKEWLDSLYSDTGWAVVDYIFRDGIIKPEDNVGKAVEDHTRRKKGDKHYTSVPLTYLDHGQAKGSNKAVNKYKKWMSSVVEPLGWEVVSWMGTEAAIDNIIGTLFAAGADGDSYDIDDWVSDAFKDVEIQETKFSKEWWKKELILEEIEPKSLLKQRTKGKELLLMGGAYGHLNHPFDNKNLTFGDFKTLIINTLQGKLNNEGQVAEKTDGQNIMISWINGNLRAARNKGHLKNFGAASLDINGVRNMFSGRGDIEKAFVYAMTDLEKSIGSLSKKQKEKIFGNGKRFMSLEIIYPATSNVIPYGKSLLQFHGTIEYDASGTPIGSDSGSARVLAGMIKQINQNIQKTFSVTGPFLTKLPKVKDFSSKQSYFLGKLNRLQKQFNLKDTDTLADYHQAYWMEYIFNGAKQTDYPNPANNVLMKLTKRWAFLDKSYKIPQIRKDLQKHPKFLDWVLNTDKQDHARLQKQHIRDWEVLFFELGAEVLSNLSDFIAANPNQAVQKIRNDLVKAISKVKTSKDPKVLYTLKTQLDRLNAIGGLKAVVPTEGITFMFKGKLYKYTGAFAPANQILGMLKFV